MTKALLLLTVFALSGCARTALEVNPDWTTYPHGLVVQENESIKILGGAALKYRLALESSERGLLYQIEGNFYDYFTYDYLVTRIGDKAEHKVFILPPDRASRSEKALFQLVPSVGQKICGDDFRLSSSSYYFGDEYTIALAGFQSPALRIRYRCPVYSGRPASDAEERVRQISGAFKNHRFFDVLSKNFTNSEEELFRAVSSAARERGMPSIDEGSVMGGRFLLAGNTPPSSDSFFGPIEQLAAVATRSDKGSAISFILLVYKITNHVWPSLKRTMPINHPFNIKRIVPWDRKEAFERAREFLGLVAAKLQNGVASAAISDPASSDQESEAVDRDIIRLVQKALLKRGFNPGSLDGIMGPRTATAIADFQKFLGVTITHEIDKDLLSDLELL